jgi:hypothetical protein
MEDQTAIRILKTIGTQLKSTAGAIPSNPDATAALRAAFSGDSEAPPTEGELARAALDLLSADPAFAEPIRVMAAQSGPSGPQRYIEPATIALTSAVLLALQTRIKFKLDHTHKWSLEIEKKATADATVKLVAQRLLAYLDKPSG